MTTTRTAPPAIDARRWPDVAQVPHHPARARFARLLTRHALGGLPLRVTLPDGTWFGAGTGDDPGLTLVRPDDFYHRLGAGGLIGFGESYMAGDWESAELAGLLTVLAGRVSSLVPPALQRLRRVVLRARPAEQDNTLTGARANIGRHYDLSNELFALFLDPSLSYSSALFAAGPAAESLLTAQHRKIDRILDLAGVTAGTRLLEIGTGWGELAIRAASRGAQVTTVTISTEQATLARQRIAAAGWAGRVSVRLQDYREIEGEFDAVVSVEMIEAVGAEHWPDYFGRIARLLRPGGRAGVQAITMPHDRMLASRNTYTWIVKYIFPGGELPSVRAVREQATAAGLRADDGLGMGRHYAETLRRWRARFEAAAAEVDALGFDEVFRRMWSLYLAYSEAGFASGYLDVRQFCLTRPGDSG
ncbi:MAG TPA: cyclopropane-fatty-acyl-phospholipid synthase family protein [Jatrophihabitans sp.]|nr:cyclopropane-fatty-acyl-phospholipid synthase family protein [Jatrophihabitans sp.]